MLAIFIKTLPFFTLIGLGYAAARMRFISAEMTSWLTRFVFFWALSAMLFQLAAELSLARIWNPAMVRAYLCATGGLYLALFLLARLRHQPLGAAAVEAQCGSIGNTGFLGLPMLAMLLGPQSAAPLLLILTLDSVLFASIATLLITAEREGRLRFSSLRALGLGLLRNPMIVSMLAGFLWSGIGLPVPQPLDETLSLLGRSATPLALFAIGASLAQRTAERLVIAGWLAFAKLLVHPALAALMALKVFAVEPVAAGVMIAASALPVAGNVYILARYYGVASQRASAAILISTAASIVTLPVVIACLATM